GCAGGCPAVLAAVVPPAVVQIDAVTAAPHDHFTAGPNCPVKESAKGRVGSAGGYPAIGARIVFRAGVQIAAAVPSTPHDHFAAGPDCRVKLSAVWRADNVRWSPCVIGARIRVGNLRKSVDAFA